jgi:glycyl-tRNA synthetase beta chain
VADAAQGYSQVELSEENRDALVEFLLARLRVLLTDQGYAYDIIDSAMASGDDRIVSLLKKADALAMFAAGQSWGDLITGFERVANLAAPGTQGNLEPKVFQPADERFHQGLGRLEHACQEHLAKQDYPGILQLLAEFRRDVDAFFADVMIMDKDLTVRGNRLALLNQALRLYSLCGDLQLIVGNR